MSKLDINAEKSALLKLINQNVAQPFHFKQFFPGHRSTNFPMWYNSTEPYMIKWAFHFEPYVIVKLNGLPLFDERFIGYGFNKVSFFMELDAMNYKMAVHPSAFVVHVPHPFSSDKVRFDHNQNKYMTCIRKRKKKFVNELAKKYSVNPKKYRF